MNGIDMGMNGISKPVQTWTKSDINKTSDRVLLQTDDDFSTEKPGYQWKFNHNPDCNLYDRTGLPAAPFRTVGNCPCFIGGYDMVLNQTIFYATIE